MASPASASCPDSISAVILNVPRSAKTSTPAEMDSTHPRFSFTSWKSRLLLPLPSTVASTLTGRSSG